MRETLNINKTFSHTTNTLLLL